VSARTRRLRARAAFGEFELDRLGHQLRRGIRPIRLQQQPYKVLKCLLERAGRAVTRDELHECNWPSSVFVDFDQDSITQSQGCAKRSGTTRLPRAISRRCPGSATDSSVTSKDQPQPRL